MITFCYALGPFLFSWEIQMKRKEVFTINFANQPSKYGQGYGKLQRVGDSIQWAILSQIICYMHAIGPEGQWCNTELYTFIIIDVILINLDTKAFNHKYRSIYVRIFLTILDHYKIPSSGNL